MSDLVLHYSWRQRLSALLFGLFAAIAFVLAALGAWAVVSYTVSRQTREIGIRIALGAQRRQVIRLVVRHGLAPVLLGLAAGLAAAFAMGRALGTLLYGVAPRDPATFASACAGLLAAAVAACYLPARRAAKIEPMAALRHE